MSTIKTKEKKCKASGPVLPSDFEGCGEMALYRKFGLCNGCLIKWYQETPEGREKLNKAAIKATGSTVKKILTDSKRQTKIKKDSMKRKQDYEKDLETVFNRFIRLRDKDQPCISCDKQAGTYTMSAGHYYPAGSHKNIRFDEDNVHSQCWYNCNKNKSGNLSEYLPRLIAKIGEKAFRDLEQRRLIHAHYSIPEIQEMIIHYKSEVKRIEHERKAL